jgi:hypothetical protein
MALRFEKIMRLFRKMANKLDTAVVMDLAWKIPLRRAHIKRFEDEVGRCRH